MLMSIDDMDSVGRGENTIIRELCKVNMLDILANGPNLETLTDSAALTVDEGVSVSGLPDSSITSHKWSKIHDACIYHHTIS
jgi:hypothetical protein